MSTYCPAEDYESLLVSATKAKSQGAAVWAKREAWEDQLVRAISPSPFPKPCVRFVRTLALICPFGLVQAAPGADVPTLYQAYIAWELKPKKPDSHLVQNLYARAVAEQAAKGPYEAEPFWVSLMTFLVSAPKSAAVFANPD